MSPAKVIPLRPPKPEREPLVELSDGALLAGCAARESSALDLLYERHHAALYRFLSRLVGRTCPDLDDLVQMVFLSAWQSASRFRGDAAVQTWLFGIAANLARKHHRSERRRWNAFRLFSERPKDPIAAPESKAIERQFIDRLAQAIESLPHDLRVVYVMCEIEEVSGVEAAKALGLRPGTLWRRLHDARKALRRALGEEAEA